MNRLAQRPSARLTADDLPRAVAPGWMTWIWVIALVLVGLSTAAVLFGPMDERVSAPGVVRPADYSLVFPAAAGLVTEVTVAPGVEVRRGDLLARLDARDLERDRDTVTQGVARAEAELADAQSLAVQAIPHDLTLQSAEAPRLRAMVEERRKLLERMEAAGDGRGLSLVELVRERLAFQSLERELERAERVAALLAGPWAQAARDAAAARVRASEAALAGLRARLEHIRSDLAAREIRAPDDGVLVNRAVRFRGEKVELGQALFKLARGGGTRLRLYAGEDRVDRIRPGMRVLFRPKSDPDQLRPPRTGVVTEVALDRDLADDAGSRPTDGTWAIDVEVDDGLGDLPLGASVEAEIILGQRRFVHLLMTKPAK
jgi:multidrug resistance efflux pump